jgi:hypothetical protein
MRRSRRSRPATIFVAAAAVGLTAVIASPDIGLAQQRQQQQQQQQQQARKPTAPPPQVRQAQPRQVQQSRPSNSQAPKREVTKVTKNTGSSGDSNKRSPSTSNTASRPVTKPPVKETADKKPTIREAAPKPVAKPVAKSDTVKKTDTAKTVDTVKKPVQPQIKVGGPAAADPNANKRVPVNKPTDLTKVDPKKVDPKNPTKPVVAGPLGPIPPGGNTKTLPLGQKTGGPTAPVTLPGQKTAGQTPQTRPFVMGPPPPPAKGLNIKPMTPVKTAWVDKGFLGRPTLPPGPAPRFLGGPSWYQTAPRFSWYPWGGRKYLPYFFVGTVVTGAVVVAGYNYWTPPPPSCYAGGSTVYYYPGTRVCYDFSVAREDDDFECHGKVFKYRPSRYRTVETMIENEAPTAVPVATWVEKSPERKVQVQAAIERAAARAKTVAAVAAVTPEKLDCSACVVPLGPTEGEDGQATVSMVNNCDHAVTVSGGLVKSDAAADTPPVCEWQGEVPAGQEVVACTKPTADFTEVRVFMNGVVPVEGTTQPAASCRIPDQPKAN